jgi:hypothetical protein
MNPSATAAAALTSPQALRVRLAELGRDRSRSREQLGIIRARLQSVHDLLALAPGVEAALEKLSQEMFNQIVGLLEQKLSIALQEVLEQPIRLRADASFKRGSASVEFHIEHNGQHEDILRGQGGSVANILSVGLRMFALAQLDPDRHRRFLLLDEQDCWLRPDLVPRLVRIIHQAGQGLGFQVVLISHHDVDMFEQYADRIYEFVPQPDGAVRVQLVSRRPGIPDET